MIYPQTSAPQKDNYRDELRMARYLTGMTAECAITKQAPTNVKISFLQFRRVDPYNIQCMMPNTHTSWNLYRKHFGHLK
jgi:hypothetical protein